MGLFSGMFGRDERIQIGRKAIDESQEALAGLAIKQPGDVGRVPGASGLQQDLIKGQAGAARRDLTRPADRALRDQRGDRSRQRILANQQTQLADAAYRRSMGQGASVAESQLRRGANRAMSQQLAMAAGSRNIGAGMRAAAQNVGDIQAQTNQDAAIARLQEQQQAQQLALGAYGQAGATLGQARGQTLQAGQLAGQQALGAATVQDRAAQQAMQQRLGLAQLQQHGALSQAQLGQRADLANLAATQALAEGNAGRTQQGQQMGLNFIGGLANTVGSAVGALSDKRAKTDVEDARPALEEFLSELAPKEYRYKDPADGEGKHAGVMAQDLEDSDVGDRYVDEDGEGRKRVDYGKMGPTMLASLAYLHERIGKLEGGKRA